MARYTVSVVRIGYAHRDITVDADSEQEAVDKAVDTAGNYEFSEHDADYKADYVKEVE